MKKLVIISLLTFAALLCAVERIDILDNEPFPLTHWLSEAEAARWDEIGRDFYETDPPPAPVHNVAEFERMEAVVIRYPFGVPMSLISDMSQHVTVITIVASQAHWGAVEPQYINGGVNMDNAEYLIASTDSYWTRDFGPWFVIDGDGEFGVANFPYNRPRPNDDDVPIEVADYLEINLFGMNVTHTGGNYMTDGLGISASSDLVYTENSISNAEVNQRMLDFLGIQTYHVVEDPNNTYIDHIDCWGKFLDVDKVLIREVPPSHAQYDEIEEVAAYFASQTSSYGNNYQVYRVYTPGDQPYTNSLILNDHVYVPMMNNGYDDQALAAYEEAMPGYTIVGIDSGAQPWESTDALHCRTKGIADQNMLYIYHLPYLDEQPSDVAMPVSADITAYSGAGVVLEEVFLHYKIGDGEWIDELMTTSDMTTWSADIPGQPSGSIVSYYITAYDADANYNAHPFIGEADPHTYFCGGIQAPELDVDPESFDIEISADTTAYEVLDLTNIGGGVINYTIEFMDTTRDITGSYVECSSEFFIPGETVDFQFTAYNNSGDTEWIKGVEIAFPEGFEVISATHFSGGTGGEMEYDGVTGNGATVTWFGETTSGFGVLRDGESAVCSVEVSVSLAFNGDAELGWTLTGDNYGSDPHQISGMMELFSYGGPVSWISADQYGGDLWAWDMDSIILTIDSEDLDPGEYSCNIIINWEGGENTIPVNLTVSATPATQEEIFQPVNSLISYPNPFQPANMRSVITLEFALAEKADLDIDVFNIRGQKIADIFKGNLPSGKHQMYWNGKDSSGNPSSNGVYFFKIHNSNFEFYQKTLIIK